MARLYSSPSTASLLCASLASCLASIIVPTSALPTLPLRLNAGGPAFQDSVTGFLWESDSTYLSNGGGRYSVGTDISDSGIDMRVYQSERYFPAWTGTTGTYAIPVEAGLAYGVVLHFCEIYFQTPGARIFQVWVENELVFPAIDIVEQAGSDLKTLVLYVQSPVVTDGILTVELVGSKNNPKLSGLEVFDLADFVPPTAPPTPEEHANLVPIRINAGGPAYEDQLTGYWWESDAAYLPGGGGIATVTKSISGTDLDMRVYQSERFFAPWAGGSGHFEIPVEPGKSYGVVLHFCEIHFTAVNKRLFQVFIQDEEAFPSIDIVALAGGSMSALVLHAQSPNVTDGILSIDLVGLVQNPKISGLEILDLVSSRTGVKLQNWSQLFARCSYLPKVRLRCTPLTRSIFTFRRIFILPMLQTLTSLSRFSSTAEVEFTVRLCAAVIWKCKFNSPSRPHHSWFLWLCTVEENGLRMWQADTEYFQGGYVFTSMADITGTREPAIYRTERYGEFIYQIPVEEGEYGTCRKITGDHFNGRPQTNDASFLVVEVILHFAEVFFDQVGQRVFNIKVEDEYIMDVDIVEKVAGHNKALTLESVVIVSDGYLSLEFFDAVPKVNNPKLSAISVKKLGPHLAHTVADGPVSALVWIARQYNTCAGLCSQLSLPFIPVHCGRLGW